MWPRLSTSEYRFLWMYSIVLTRSAFRLAVSRVEWNVTGYVYLQSNFDRSLLCSFCRTILSSAGNDGRVRLWKVGTDGEWKSAGSISVEQAEQESKADQRNVGTVWIRSVAMSAIALNIGSYLSHLLLSVPRTIRTPSTRTVRTSLKDGTSICQIKIISQNSDSTSHFEGRFDPLRFDTYEVEFWIPFVIIHKHLMGTLRSKIVQAWHSMYLKMRNWCRLDSSPLTEKVVRIALSQLSEF